MRAQIDGTDIPYPLVVDADGKPLGWLSEKDLARETVELPPDIAAVPLIDNDAVLRDALSELLAAGVQYGPVVDARGGVVGVLSVGIITDLLAQHDTREIDPAERIAT